MMFSKVLDKIKPTKKEEQDTQVIVDGFLKKVNSKLINAIAVVGGSFAKGTWLRGQHDIDVFVLFNKRDNMSMRLEVVIKSIFEKYEKIHGSRDYFIVNYCGLSFELVPVLKIEKAEDAENITDVSPMHVEWVKNNINDKLADDIRLAKCFMKANNCYGAETFVGGFSGYLVELLVIHYGSFNELIKNVSEWKHGHVVDIEKNNKFESGQKFPLVVIDPVQPNRNTSAALRHEKFDMFVEICKKFNSKPRDKFFKEKKINLKKYDLVFKVTPLDGSKDVVGTKMLKAFERIKDELNNYGFGIKDCGWHWGEYAYFYFKVGKKKLDKTLKHYGPPISFEEDAKKFRIKHKELKIGEENGKLFVMIPRKFVNIKDFIISIAEDKKVIDRVKNIVKE